MRREIRQLADVCVSIAEKAAQPDGFVPVRRLVELFGAELEARPLLYEGMIAAPKSADFRWKVLINSKSGQFDASRYANESSTNALPARVRFTVAHELTHMLRYRAKEYGVELQLNGTKKKSGAEVVRDLERETDRLTPLLLVPDGALEAQLVTPATPISIDVLSTARTRWGISREVFVNRLNLLRLADGRGLRFNRPLRNIGVGLGAWLSGGVPTLHEWPPSFANFDDGLVPSLLSGPAAQRMARAQKAFGSPSFCLNGGDLTAANAEVLVGTDSNPESASAQSTMEVEEVSRRSGKKFLFVVRTGSGW